MAEINPDNKFQELLDLYDQIIASGAPEEEVEAAFLEEAAQGGLGRFNSIDELRRAGMSAYQVGTGLGSQLAAGAESFAQDASFGLTDELAGLITGLIPGGMDREEGTEAYRARLQGQREQFPKTTFGGGLLGMLYGGGKFIQGAKKLPGIGRTIRRGVDERTLLPRLPGVSKDPRLGGILTDVPLMAADLGIYNVGKTEGSLPERLESTARSAQGLLDQYGAGPIGLGSAAISTVSRRLPFVGGARKSLVGTPDEGVVVARRLDELLESPDIIGRSRRMTDGAFDEVDNFFKPENFDVLSKGSFSKTTGEFIPSSGTTLQKEQLEAVEKLSDWLHSNRALIQDMDQAGGRGELIKSVMARLDNRRTIRQPEAPGINIDGQTIAAKEVQELQNMYTSDSVIGQVDRLLGPVERGASRKYGTMDDFKLVKRPQGYNPDGTWYNNANRALQGSDRVDNLAVSPANRGIDNAPAPRGSKNMVYATSDGIPVYERTATGQYRLTDAARKRIKQIQTYNKEVTKFNKQLDEAFEAAKQARKDKLASQLETIETWPTGKAIYEPTQVSVKEMTALRDALRAKNKLNEADNLNSLMEAAYSNMTTRAGVKPTKGAFATANRQFALGSQLEQAYDMGFSLKGGSLGVGGGGGGQIAFKAQDVMTPDGLRRILDQIASSPLGGKGSAKELQEAFLQGVWQRNVIGELRANKRPEIFNVMQRSTKEGQEFLRLFFPEGRAGQRAFEQARLVIMDNIPSSMKLNLLQRIMSGVMSGFAHRLGGKGVGG